MTECSSNVIAFKKESCELKLEDFHDESSTAWINPSPIILKNSGLKQLVKQTACNINTINEDEYNMVKNKEPFSEIYNAVPQIKEHFVIEKKIGSGTFSNVYLAQIKGSGEDGEFFALKHIFSTSHPKRIENEIKCLKNIGGKENVIGIESCLRHKGEVVIIMPYVEHTKFSELINVMEMVHVREYMRSLLVALQHVHSFNVIHRDVKPNNFLFNLKTNSGGLVDFGLAQEINLPKTTSTNAQFAEKCHLKPNKPPKNDVTCKSAGKPVKNQPVLGGRRCMSLGSPRAKRRCLVEIQPNNLPLNRNIDAKTRKRTLPLHNNSENIITNQITTPSKLPQKFKFMSLKSKQINQPALKKNNVTIADIIPSIKNHKCKNKSSLNVANKDACNCFGKMIVCYKCLARPTANASRAGTAGFRPPEVLLRYKEQTTAVDIWAAGVIFISLLSGRCPFFQPADDMSSLAQLMLVFGSKKIETIARICGKKLTTSTNFQPYDLQAIIMSLRSTSRNSNEYVRRSPRQCKVANYSETRKSISPKKQPKSPEKKCKSSSPTKLYRSPLKSQQQHILKIIRNSPQSVKCVGFDATDIPGCAYTLLSGLLDPNPVTRLTAKQALQHNFFKN